MSVAILIHGAISQGRFMPDSQTEWAVTFARLNGKRAVITVEPETRKRSNSQNKYYWAIPIEILRHYCGMTASEMHDAVRHELLYDIVIVGKKELRKLKSTAKLSTAEMEDYLMALRTWAATELGVDIPEPGEVSYNGDES
jgi:hypothetical protein